MENPRRPHRSDPVGLPALTRIILISVGFLCVALGALGLLLPVMPTTPFLLLAAACFARSSPRFYDWLLNLRLFGTLIRNWQQTRSIPIRAKLLAIAAILVLGGASLIFFIERTLFRILVAIILLLHILLIVSIRSSEAARTTEKD